MLKEEVTNFADCKIDVSVVIVTAQVDTARIALDETQLSRRPSTRNVHTAQAPNLDVHACDIHKIGVTTLA